MSTKVLLIFLFFSYFLIQSFLFFLFSESRVSYFPIFLSDQAAGHPVYSLSCSFNRLYVPFVFILHEHRLQE